MMSQYAHAIDDKQVECLAKNIYFEARGEPIKGQIAVAQVVLNRLESDDYPSNICGIVYQPNQFSWTSKRKIYINDWSLYDDIKQLAKHVIMNKPKDLTNGALFFRHKRLKVQTQKKSVIIGNHIFYT